MIILVVIGIVLTTSKKMGFPLGIIEVLEVRGLVFSPHGNALVHAACFLDELRASSP
jgi:hypothetical protein